MSTSDNSAGIQIADLILWLFWRHFYGKHLSEKSGRLLSYVFKKCYYSDFSFDAVREQVEEQWSQIMATKLSPEMERDAREMMAKNEQHRQLLIVVYEEDGLMPYQRQPMKIATEAAN